MLTCPAAELVDGSKVLYFEQVSITVQFCVSFFLSEYLFPILRRLALLFKGSMLLELAQLSFFYAVRLFGGVRRNPFARYTIYCSTAFIWILFSSIRYA
jgi:hypothetical protein